MKSFEDLDIEIERTESKIHDLKIAITSHTAYGRWPTDKDFESIARDSREHEKANQKQDVLTDLREAIEANNQL